MAKVELAQVTSTINNAAIGDSEKNDMLTQVAAAAERQPLPDTWIYRIIVLALGLAIFVPVLAMLVGDTGAEDLELGRLVLPIATAALGALAGLLAPSPGSRN